MPRLLSFLTLFLLLCCPAIGQVAADSTALRTDSVVLHTDTVTVATDSLKPKRSGIDAPVHFVGKDSLIYVSATRLAHIYGEADVTYQNMHLTADHMTLNMDSSLVHARASLPDSVGDVKGRPIYQQGSDSYESDMMSFNFKTKRGFIHNVTTQQGNGYMQAEQSRRDDDGTIYMQGGRYTTCDADHPHFYLKLSRAKVRPGKESIFGPAYLVVEDVPLPLAVPYGFFPFSKKYSSGIVMPSYGDESSRGFYLRDGGYYFAINDYLDFKALGEIYTKGSWGVSGEVNYRKRYRFSGNLYVNYLTTVEGEKNMPDYSKTKSIKVQWTHRKDSKGTGSATFSARVNFASQSFERKNLDSRYNPLSYSQSTRASSVSWGKTFSRIGLSLSASGNLTQNMRDSTLSISLPELSINLSRLYPFKRKHAAGKERWYEKISLSYTGQISNSFQGKEADLLKSNILKDWRNGMQHRIPVDATFQLFKYINITPNFSFRDIMYKERVNRSWDELHQREVRDTVSGFNNLYDWNAGVSLNTTLYGFYRPTVKFLQRRIVMVRHVLKPNVSLSYAPDFTKESYGYTASYVRTDRDGNVSTVSYSPYQGMLYGYPSSGQQGLISMSLSNNVEMKVRTANDSIKKVSLIDELSANMSYNMAAKVRPWSDLSMRVRLKLTKNYTFSLNAVFATYAYEFDQRGNVVVGNRTEYSQGRFGRFQGMSQNISYTLNNDKLRSLWEKLTGQQPWRGSKSPEPKTREDDSDEDDDEDANVDPDIRRSQKDAKRKQKAKVDDDGYLAFSLPWSVSFSYGITLAENRKAQINAHRMRYPYALTHTLNFSGYVRIAEGWNITWSSGYDFNRKRLSTTTASLSRDLHCFEMSASVVLAPFTSYHFTFRARASELADALKWEKRSSYSSNVQWY
ncbi:MAG: LPS-assembly protein LptD [Bacteroidaceae bacterium]|nr:LPS-assembly protein LptD [Bacteroidaceae bacterium]